MSHPFLAPWSWVACLVVAQATTAAYAQAPSLTLAEAMARARLDQPSLSAADAGVRAAAAGVRQADRAPNPTLDVLGENLLGSGPYRSIDRAETTFSLSQRLEAGGDRAARTRLAESDADVARTERRRVEAALVYNVQLAFIDAQRRAAELDLARARLTLAQEIARSVARRVEAARDPLLAGSRAQTSLIDAERVLARATAADAEARARLAGFWTAGSGSPSPDVFAVDQSTFERLEPAGGPHELAGNPDIAQAEVAESRAEAAIDVERARARPDPTVSAGVRLFGPGDEAAFVVGVSIPLAVRDSNRAAIDKASHERRRALFETEALKRDIARETATAQAQLAIARTETEMLDARLIPSAEEAEAQARDGYARGGFSYLDVLDSQRALADLRQQRIDALFTFHTAQAALDRLSGAHVAADPQESIP